MCAAGKNTRIRGALVVPFVKLTEAAPELRSRSVRASRTEVPEEAEQLVQPGEEGLSHEH